MPLAQIGSPGGKAQVLALNNNTQNRITGQNVGAGNIYIGKTNTVSANNYDQLLGVGGTFSWPGGSTLYCTTDDGSTSTLSYNTDGADVTTGAVALTHPVTVGQSNLNGDVLGTWNTPINAGATVNILDTGATGLEPYETLVIRKPNNQLIIATADVTEVSITWFSADGVTALDSDICFVYTNGGFFIELPIKSPRAVIALNPSAGSNFGGTVTIEGLSVQLPRNYGQSPSFLHPPSGDSAFTEHDNNTSGSYFASYTSTGNFTLYAPSLSGPGYFTYSNLSGAATQIDIQIIGPTGVEGHVARFTQAANSTSAPIPILFPEMPIRIVQTQAGAAELSIQFTNG